MVCWTDHLISFYEPKIYYMTDLDFFSAIRMDEKDLIDFMSLRGSNVFEFKGVNNRRVSMSRGGSLHKWLISALEELAFISKKQKKTVYLVDVDKMVQEETGKYYNRTNKRK